MTPTYTESWMLQIIKNRGPLPKRRGRTIAIKLEKMGLIEFRDVKLPGGLIGGEYVLTESGEKALAKFETESIARNDVDSSG
jgi:hypothetical protein